MLENKRFNIEEDFQITESNGGMLVGEAMASSQFPTVEEFLTDTIQVPADRLLELTMATASIMEAVLRGHDWGYNANTIIGSRNSVDLPQGIYPINFPLIWAYGDMKGHGSGVSGNVDGDRWNTNSSHLFMDHARWPQWVDDYYGFRALKLASIWRSELHYSWWQESADVSGIRYHGDAHNAPDPAVIPCYGIYTGTTGENWSIAGQASVYISNFTADGIRIAGGAGPGKIGQISSFDNWGAGLRADTMNSFQNLLIDQLSCDNNRIHLHLPNGGSARFGCIKNETGLSESRGEPKRDSIAIKVDEGWFDVSGGLITAHSVNGRSPVLIDVNHSNGARSSIKVDAIDGNGYDKTFIGRVNGAVKDTYDFQDIAVQSLHWTNDGKGLIGNVFSGDNGSGGSGGGSGAIYGCTDPTANNYNPNATVDDGSCTYDPGPVLGCTDPEALNYNPNATEDDGSCVYDNGGEPGELYARFRPENAELTSGGVGIQRLRADQNVPSMDAPESFRRPQLRAGKVAVTNVNQALDTDLQLIKKIVLHNVSFSSLTYHFLFAVVTGVDEAGNKTYEGAQFNANNVLQFQGNDLTPALQEDVEYDLEIELPEPVTIGRFFGAGGGASNSALALYNDIEFYR